MLVGLLTSLAALAAAVIGIFKKSMLDNRRRGWHRLTATGRTVLIIALSSFSVSVYREWQEASMRKEQHEKETLIQVAAARELIDAINVLLRPFKLAEDATSLVDGGKRKDELAFERFTKQPVDDLAEFGKADFVETLAKLDAEGCPPQFGSSARCRWADIVAQSAEQGDRDLLSIIDRYSAVLDPELLRRLSEIRNDEMLSIMKSAAGNVDMNVQMGNETHGMTLQWLLLGPHAPEEIYMPFFRRIDGLLQTAYMLANAEQKSLPASTTPQTKLSGVAKSDQAQPGLKQHTQLSQSESHLGGALQGREFQQTVDAATQGDAKAQLKLGRIYDIGDGVKQDHTEAVKWLKLSASQGNPTAQGMLALSYANGDGTTQDYTEAAKWFRLSASQGNVLSQYSLGILCSDGKIPSQEGEAAQWFGLAAAQGYGKARYNLGVLYEHGTGVEKNLVRAHMWFGFAAESNEGAVREAAEVALDRIAAQLTGEQIAASHILAEKCRSTHWKDCN